MSKRKRDDNNTAPFLKGDIVRVIKAETIYFSWGDDELAKKYGLSKKPKPERITMDAFNKFCGQYQQAFGEVQGYQSIPVADTSDFVAFRLCGSPEGFFIQPNDA